MPEAFASNFFTTEDTEATEADLGTQDHETFRAANPSAQFGLLSPIDRHVEIQRGARLRQSHRVGIGDRESVERAALGCVDRWMHGIWVPFDEEGQDAVAVVGEVEGSPLEKTAVWAGARTVAWTVEGDAGGFELRGQRFKVSRMFGPVDQARGGE